jgi:hypothetical protein
MYTNKVIEELEVMFEEIVSLGKETDVMFSEMLIGAVERNHTIIRNNKNVVVTEDILWFEVQNLGSDCEAGKYLATIYPEFFEKTKLRQGKVSTMEQFVNTNLGINALQMSLVDIIKLVKGVCKMMIDEQAKCGCENLEKGE